MERAPRLWLRRIILANVAAWGVLTQVGCIGLISNLLYDGRMVNARYDRLKEQKVAVVCLSGDAIQSPHSTSTDLAARVEHLLKENVPGIQIIGHEIVADWIDNNNWDQVGYDCRKIGRGVGADKLVVIELGSFSLHEGGTMFKGRCEVSVTVYDMTKGGESALVLDNLPIAFPANGAQSTATCREPQFRNDFLKVVAVEVARNFYRHDGRVVMALDSTLISR
jgi:hypothetical protein